MQTERGRECQLSLQCQRVPRAHHEPVVASALRQESVPGGWRHGGSDMGKRARLPGFRLFDDAGETHCAVGKSPQGHTQAYTAMRSQHFFQWAAAYGGPPQHFTEAWQDELWKNLSMQPVEQSHLKGSTTSPAKSTQLFGPPCPAPEAAYQRFPPPMNTRSK